MECILCGSSKNTKYFNEMVICNTCYQSSICLFENNKKQMMFVNPTNIYNFDNKYIYIGPEESSLDKNKLHELEITNILVCGKKLDVHFPNDFEYKILEIDDSLEQNISDLFLEVINFINNSKKNILIHCVSGRSRSVAFLTLFIMHKENKSFDKVYADLKIKYPKSLVNSSFQRQLKNFII